MPHSLWVKLDLTINPEDYLKRDISFAINDYPSQKQSKKGKKGVKLHKIITHNTNKEN